MPNSQTSPSAKCRVGARTESNRLKLSILLCLITLLCSASGCTRFGGSSLIDWWRNGFKVGPNYGRPAAIIADDWIEAESHHVQTDPIEDVFWWTRLEDPCLDQLITLASQQNLTLQSTGMRILEARAIRGVAVGSIFPQRQTFGGQYLTTLQSLNQGLALPTLSDFDLPRDWQNFDGMFGLGWEIDVWGRYRRNIESATADFEMTVEDYDGILVSLLAEVATNYVQLRTYQQRLIYARANVAAQEGSLRIATVRFEAGETDKLDVTQAKSNLESTKSLIPALEIGVRQAENAICVLLGMPPQNLDQLIPDRKKPIPHVPADVNLGTPADLIRRRPDLRALERAAASASARIGVVASSLYPSFAIDGTIGVSARNWSSLWESNSIGGTFDPRFDWKILNYGRIMNEIAAQDAVFQERAVEYQQQILNANKEVEDALIAYLKNQQQVKILLDGTNAYKESVRLATLKYKAGETDFNQVFLLQSDLTKIQDKLAQAEGSVATSLVGIYRALGSGWQIRLREQPALAAPEMVEDLPQPPAEDLGFNEEFSKIETSFLKPPKPTENLIAEPRKDVSEIATVDRIIKNQLIGEQKSIRNSSNKVLARSSFRENMVLDSNLQIRKVTELVE